MPPRDHFTSRPATTAGKRRLPRLKTEFISCELGEVTNLSMAGLRVRTARQHQVGEAHVIIIRGFDQSAGPIHATVSWCKDGEAGLQFTKAARSVRKNLSDLAMLARDQRSFSARP